MTRHEINRCWCRCVLWKLYPRARLGKGPSFQREEAPQGQARREPASRCVCARSDGRGSTTRGGLDWRSGIETQVYRGQGRRRGAARALEFTPTRLVGLRADYRRDVRIKKAVEDGIWPVISPYGTSCEGIPESPRRSRKSLRLDCSSRLLQVVGIRFLHGTFKIGLGPIGNKSQPQSRNGLCG